MPGRLMRGLLFDLDGVVYNGEQLIPGAPEAIAWVRAQTIPYLFVTNTSSRGRDALVEKLTRFGIPCTEEEILSPAVAAADWLRTQPPAPIALFVKSKTRPEFSGLTILPEDAETGARYVVIGDLGEDWDFRTLNRAFRCLHSNPDAQVIALGMTRYWQAADGVRLDVAPFVAALEHATGRPPLIFGKPGEPFFTAAVNKLALPASEIVMIGDDVHIDIGGAQRAGLQGALVRTGKFRPSDLDGAIKSDYVLDSIASIIELKAHP
jgi:phospholysine phosphohistidine inorganic pyrophosphate phosphatase